MTKHIIAAALTLALAASANASVNFRQVKIKGITLNIVEIEGERIIPVTASGTVYSNKVYTSEPFDSIAAREPFAATINGCFFDTITDRPIGDIVAEGKKLTSGGAWAHFGIRNDGSTEFDLGGRKDWKNFSFGITCLPLLVKNGHRLIGSADDMRAAGFHDPVVFLPMTRAAIGSAPGGKILFITSSRAFMYDFAQALVETGVDNAIGLDGGSATGMTFGGKTIMSSSMELTHIFAVAPPRDPEE